jgi:hypothetical protein
MAAPRVARANPTAIYDGGAAVPDGELHGAAVAGLAKFPSGRVNVRSLAGGSVVSIDQSELDKALSSGMYQIETGAQRDARKLQEAHGGLGSQAIALAEGAGRGATFGGSDIALTAALGDEYREGAAARQRVNPGAAMAGELAGLGASVLASGGAAGVARLGTVGKILRGVTAPARGAIAAGEATAQALGRVGVSGASALGRAARVGTAGAVEGGLYGAGMEASRATLAGDGITADKLLAATGNGALWGGAAGAGLTLAGAGLRRGATSVADILGGGGTKGLAEEAALKAVGGSYSEVMKLPGMDKAGRAREVGREVLEYEMDDGTRLLQGLKKSEDLVERVKIARSEVGREIGAIEKRVASVDQGIDARRLMAHIEETIIAPLESSGVAGLVTRGAAVRKQLGFLTERARPATEGIVRRDGAAVQRSNMISFEELQQKRRALSDFAWGKGTAGKGQAPLPPEGAQHLLDAERYLSTELKNHAEQSLAKLGENPDVYRKLNRSYSNLRAADDMITKAVNGYAIKTALNHSDRQFGLVSFLGALATGNVGALGSAVFAGGATVASKLLKEYGPSTAAVLLDRAGKTSKRMTATVPGVVSQTGKRAKQALPLGAAAIESEYHERAQRVREFLGNPALADRRVAEFVAPIADEYPELAARMIERTHQRATFLASKIPPSMTRADSSFTPQVEKPRVASSDMKKFLRYVRGIDSPMDVVEDLAAGHLDREGIEAIKVGSPDLFNELRERVIENTLRREEPLPFKTRILLGTVFDFPADKSMIPEYGRAAQEALALNEKQNPARRASPSPTSKTAKTMLTDSQRV